MRAPWPWRQRPGLFWAVAAGLGCYGLTRVVPAGLVVCLQVLVAAYGFGNHRGWRQGWRERGEVDDPFIAWLQEELRKAWELRPGPRPKLFLLRAPKPSAKEKPN